MKLYVFFLLFLTTEATLKRTSLGDSGLWTINNSVDVDEDAVPVSLRSYDFVESTSPLMVEHNFECEFTLQRGDRGDEIGIVSMWIVKDVIKTLDSESFSEDFEGLCVRLDMDRMSVQIKGSAFQTEKEALCERALTNVQEGKSITFKIVGGMGNLELHADSEEGWVNCASADVKEQEGEKGLWGYHHIALSYESAATSSSSNIRLSDLVVTSIEHGPTEDSSPSKENDDNDDDDDIGGMSPDDLRNLIYKMRATHRREISELHDHLEMQFEAMDSHLNKMMNRVRDHEAQVEKRILKLEEETNTKVTEFTEEHIGQRHRWVGPYLIVFLALCAVAMFGYKKYHYLLKQHLL